MKRLCRIIALLGVATAMTGLRAHADVVTDWNIKTLELTQAVQASGNAQARTLAMVHVAMSDAINSVKGRYTRYAASIPLMPSASAEAAAAAAATKRYRLSYSQIKKLVSTRHLLSLSSRCRKARAKLKALP